MGWYTVKMCVTYINQAMIGIELMICQLFIPFGRTGWPPGLNG